MSRRTSVELHEIDPGTLTPAQWDAVKRIATERAHAERTEAFRHAFHAIRAWLRGKRVFSPLLRKNASAARGKSRPLVNGQVLRSRNNRPACMNGSAR